MTVDFSRSPRSRRPLLLDLFCGAGGAAKGYYDAGFDVVGVDLHKQPRYPYPFIQDDALAFMEWMLAGNSDKSFDAIHASPPCQRFSTLSKRYRTDRLHTFPDLLGPARETLAKAGLPYVIENVPGAPLVNPVVLCGSHFNLASVWPNVGLPGSTGKTEKVGLRRHRGFEVLGFRLPAPGPCDHSYRAVPVYGYTNNRLYRGKGLNGESFSDLRQQVMGIDWMGHEELNEAIPPAYTRYVGKFLLEALSQNVAA